MNKKTIFILSIFGIIAVLFSFSALADGLTITDFDVSTSGSVIVSWEDPENSGPYKVLFQPVTERNEEMPTGNMVIWCNSGDVEETRYCESYTVPDTSWWFIIQDSAGNQTYAKYNARKPENKNFSDFFTFEAKGAYVSSSSGNFIDCSKSFMFQVTLDKEDLLDLSERETFGLIVTTGLRQTNMPSAMGNYDLKYTISEIPSYTGQPDSIIGSPYVQVTDSSMPVVLNSERTNHRFFVDLSPYFLQMDRAEEDISGEYLIAFYFDGTQAGSVMLKVKG